MKPMIIFVRRWDEWVDESRVLKYNEANLEKHKQMIKSLKKQKPAIKRTINDLSIERNGKRKREPLPKEGVCNTF
jgi:mortality factor 4-like protein 1